MKARLHAPLAISVLVVLACGCGGHDSRRSAGTSGPSEEYKVARVVRSFLVAYAQGDTGVACRLLTPDHRQLVARRGRASCERALSVEVATSPERDLERLGGGRITKVDVGGDAAKAEVTIPADPSERFTAELRRLGGGWKLSADLARGGLASGVVPKPPPPPPRHPGEERRVVATFNRYRDALSRHDGRTVCALETEGARRRAVEGGIKLLGGRRAATREFGRLDCEHVVTRFEIPPGRIERVVVRGLRATLTVTNGANYEFRKVRGEWRFDT
jgi:hypothetical protein